MLLETQCSTRRGRSQLRVDSRIMKMHTVGVVIPLADVLTRNVRAARARRGLEQELVASRMRALGFSVWVRQTVARVEGGKRRLTADELFGLALALETRLTALLEPVRDDGPITLPSGQTMLFLTVHQLVWGGSEFTVSWNGDVPEFPAEESSREARIEIEAGYPILPPPRIRRGSLNQPRTPKSGDET